MWSFSYVVLFVLSGMLPLVCSHTSLHGWSLPQACLALFCSINFMVCVWELGLFFNRALIRRQFLALLKLTPKGCLPNPIFMFTHVPLAKALTLEHWAKVWSNYSLMDPSYSDQTSFGCGRAGGWAGGWAGERAGVRAHSFSLFRPVQAVWPRPAHSAALLLYAGAPREDRAPAPLLTCLANQQGNRPFAFGAIDQPVCPPCVHSHQPTNHTPPHCAFPPAAQVLRGRGQWLCHARAHRPVCAVHDVGPAARAHHGHHRHHQVLPNAVWCVRACAWLPTGCLQLSWSRPDASLFDWGWGVGGLPPSLVLPCL